MPDWTVPLFTVAVGEDFVGFARFCAPVKFVGTVHGVTVVVQ